MNDAPVRTDRHRRSYSQLSEYAQCGHAFYLKRIRRLPELPSLWLPAGTAFHEVTEMYDLAVFETGGHSYQAEHFENSFRDVFDRDIEKRRAKTDVPVEQWRVSGVGKVKSRPNGEDINYWYELGPRLIGKYIEWRKAHEHELTLAAVNGEPVIEFEMLTDLGGIEVISYIDRIFQDRSTGVLLVNDLKTGKSMPRETGQLGQYSVQFEQTTGMPLTWGANYNARQGRLEPVRDLSPYTVDSLGSKFAELEARIAAGIFPPNVTNLCKSCPMRRFCKYQGGEEPGEATTIKEIS